MYEYFVTNVLLSSCNSGFRKDDSTIKRPLKFPDINKKGLEKHKDIILILLDISKSIQQSGSQDCCIK